MARYIRPFQRSDVTAVNTLNAGVWWPERSLAGWDWLFANPAGQGRDFGWVVDDDGEVTGFLGNFVQRFETPDGPRHAATGYSIIVSDRARGESRRLIAAFLAQRDVFACYTVNANARSAPLYPVWGMGPMPAPLGVLKLSWPTRPLTLVAARSLRRLSHHGDADWSRSREWLRPGRPRPLWLEAGLVTLDPAADAAPIETLWRELASGGAPVADRSAAALAWRFGDPDLTRAPLMVGCHGPDGRLAGWIVGLLAKQCEIDAPVLEIVDLVWTDDAADAPRHLVAALIANGARLGAAKVRLPVVSARLLAGLGPLAGRARREGGWGHGHIAWRGERPTGADLWAPTAFDGDYSFCLRPVPPRPDAQTRGRLLSSSRISASRASVAVGAGGAAGASSC